MCKSLAFCAVALTASDSIAISIAFKISSDVFAAMLLSFSKENTAELVFVSVKVKVQALLVSSFDTRIERINAVVSLGTV